MVNRREGNRKQNCHGESNGIKGKIAVSRGLDWVDPLRLISRSPIRRRRSRTQLKRTQLNQVLN